MLLYIKNILNAANKNGLWVGIGIFTFFFLFTRLPYYIYINIPYLFDDGPDYVAVMKQMVEGNPQFYKRPPGYILFLGLVYMVSSDVVVVTYIQSIIGFLTGIFFIFAIHKTYPQLTVWCSLAITVFSSSVIFLHFETTVLTEGLFTNFMILYFGSLVLALKTEKWYYWMLSSCIMMLIIYIRAAGQVLYPIFILLLAYMFFKKMPHKTKILYAFPVLFFYLSLNIFNYLTIDTFGYSPQGKADIIGNVLTFIEKDPQYSERMNALIDHCVLKNTDPREIEFVNTSWDITSINSIYLKYQNYIVCLQDSLLVGRKKSSPEFYKDCYDVALSTIQKYPFKYLKFLIAQYIYYYLSFDHKEVSAYPFLKDYETNFTNGRIYAYFYDAINKNGQYGLFIPPKLSEQVAITKLSYFKTKPLMRWNQKLSEWHNSIFRNLIWVAFYCIAFVYSGVIAYKSKFQNIDSIILFTLCLINFLSTFLISVVTMNMIRYNYPLHFAYYLAPIFCWILWKNNRPIQQSVKNDKPNNSIQNTKGIGKPISHKKTNFKKNKNTQ